MKRWVALKPIGYLGLILGLSGIMVPNLLNVGNGLIKLGGAIISIFGFYLLIKGRKE